MITSEKETKRFYAVCETCQAEWTHYRFGKGAARKHAQRNHHTVRVEISIAYTHNPLKPGDPPPDAGCNTLPNGDCIGTEGCMHDSLVSVEWAKAEATAVEACGGTVYLQGKKPLECPNAKSSMTPCYIKDGDMCIVEAGHLGLVCVGCERGKEKLDALKVELQK